MGLAADYRIGPSHLDVLHGGYRGFGGHCLPKDLDALIVFLDGINIENELLKSTREQNRKLIERQGLSVGKVSTHLFQKKS